MKYKGEVVHNGKTYGKTFDATNPKQVIRRMINKDAPSQFTIYIANETGDAWVYNIRKGNQATATLRHKNKELLNRDKLHDIFSNNTTIKEALKWKI